MKSGDAVNLLVETIQTHASHPWPATAPQNSPQLLRYHGDLFVISPYTTKVQRTKYRGVTSFHHYTIPTGLDDFTLDPTASRSGTTVTYGPFNDIPESDSREFLSRTQQRVELRYEFGEPVLTVTSLKRTAEVSHWGSNLNIQDEIKLRNSGPT
jgi:oligosaccharyltransferase complex subunit alpha (ribophorin I)